jgi:hypothetical protein
MVDEFGLSRHLERDFTAQTAAFYACHAFEITDLAVLCQGVLGAARLTSIEYRRPGIGQVFHGAHATTSGANVGACALSLLIYWPTLRRKVCELRRRDRRFPVLQNLIRSSTFIGA